jgi:hypothetical protein
MFDDAQLFEVARLLGELSHEELSAARTTALTELEIVGSDEVEFSWAGEGDGRTRRRQILNLIERELRKREPLGVTEEVVEQPAIGSQEPVSTALIMAASAPQGVREIKLRPILDKKGFSSNGWATAAGLDPSVVYDYLKGKTSPRPDTRKKLAEALGIALDDFPA